MKFKCPACKTVFSAKTVPFCGRQVARCKCGGMVDAKDAVSARHPVRWVGRQVSGIAGILTWPFRAAWGVVTRRKKQSPTGGAKEMLRDPKWRFTIGESGKEIVPGEGERLKIAFNLPEQTVDDVLGIEFNLEGCPGKAVTIRQLMDLPVGKRKDVADEPGKPPASPEPEPKYPACNCNREEGKIHKPGCARMVWFLANVKSECPDCGHLFLEEENVCFWCGVATRKRIVQLRVTDFVNLTMYYPDDTGATILEGQMRGEKMVEKGMVHSTKFEIYGQTYQIRGIDPGFGLTAIRAIRIK